VPLEVILVVGKGSTVQGKAADEKKRDDVLAPIMWLLEEARHQGTPVLNAKAKVHCKVF
jgi:hypothetical protein